MQIFIWYIQAASTLYGPHTLSAYIQEFKKFAEAMAKGEKIMKGPSPPDLFKAQLSLLTSYLTLLEIHLLLEKTLVTWNKTSLYPKMHIHKGRQSKCHILECKPKIWPVDRRHICSGRDASRAALDSSLWWWWFLFVF